MVAAAEGAGALDRIDVLRRFDDTEGRLVAPCVAADRAQTILGEAEALGTRLDARPRLLDRRRERQRVTLGYAQKMHGEALGRATPDAGQPRQLADERLGRGWQHAG